MSSSRRLVFSCESALLFLLASSDGAVETNSRVTGGSDEVEKRVHAVVPEAGVTLNPAFLSQDVVILPLEVSNDLGEAVRAFNSGSAKAPPHSGKDVRELVVDLVTEPGSVDDSERNAHSFLLELCGAQASTVSSTFP
jgi:hypothetical protein